MEIEKISRYHLDHTFDDCSRNNPDSVVWRKSCGGISKVFGGVFGNLNGFCEIFVKATPLIFTGLGCAVAFRTGFFNIGAEGQFYMGAIAAAVVSLNLTQIPGTIRILISVLAGFFCGGIWALLAAYMKSKFGISEIIVTIMLNYIAINFLGIAIRTFLMDPKGSVPQSARIERDAAFSYLMPPTTLHAGIFSQSELLY